MPEQNLDDTDQALVCGLTETLGSDKPWLFKTVLRLLAGGRPVTLGQIAAEASVSEDEITASLGRMPNVEFDSAGNVTGLGLTLTSTPHQFHVEGNALYAWCAFDTLFFPLILERPAKIESRCPVTGEEIRLSVSAEKVEHVEPASAVA
jgi:alkylmercury lyase